ncbi:hypothetical protein [Flammeovirga agarivorans]|uniref:Uncharacterized protein n=1 Tax=Flammeovirga agarivorans TaxID=2726742 RepID=A0A7X8XVR6_9BACT|nr:hypothetical protein [Flammeovirga agarivorans]NLR91593.1 hypothetical protein [Flammeovirga agarivorans]
MKASTIFLLLTIFSICSFAQEKRKLLYGVPGVEIIAKEGSEITFKSDYIQQSKFQRTLDNFKLHIEHYNKIRFDEDNFAQNLQFVYELETEQKDSMNRIILRKTKQKLVN